MVVIELRLVRAVVLVVEVLVETTVLVALQISALSVLASEESLTVFDKVIFVVRDEVRVDDTETESIVGDVKVD